MALSTRDTIAKLEEQGFLDKLDSTIRTMREVGKPTGPPSPIDFFKQVIGKLLIAPQDIKDIPKIPGALVEGGKAVVRNPKGVLKHLLMNPPLPSTVAAASVPVGSLSTYRNLVPLKARTYLHHMAGIPTKFSRVTEKERKLLEKLAQRNIEDEIVHKATYEADIAYLLKQKANIKAITKKKYNELDKYVSEYSLADPDIKHLNADKKLALDEIKDRINFIKADRATILEHGIIAQGGRGARQDYIKASGGKQPKGFYTIAPSDFDERNDIGAALGKYYVEPTKNKLGKIVPKAIHDVYKFYPEIYGSKLLTTPYRDLIEQSLKEIKIYGMSPLKNAAFAPGQIMRKVAFGKRPNIIDIPLDRPGDLNAYDKMARALALQAALKDELK